jgi:hypothetical protein
MVDHVEKQGLTVTPYEGEAPLPPEMMDQYPGLKPGRKTKFATFNILADAECPELLVNIYSMPEKYRPRGIISRDVIAGGYSLLVTYIEGGFISDEEYKDAQRRAQDSMEEQAKKNAEAMGGKPEDLFGPGRVESPLGQEERKPVEASLASGSIDFEDPIPTVAKMFPDEEPAAEPAPEPAVDEKKDG